MNETTKNQGTLNPSGLGGWLILLGIGLVVSPVRITTILLQTFLPIFQDGAWEILTTPGSEVYHELWGPLIILEIVANTIFVLVGIALLVLFFRRSSRFPTLYVALAIGSLLFILLDSWLGTLPVQDEPMFDPETAREVGRALISAAIWVPYILISKRVRNTFVD
jgi:hypothetical protein